MDLQVVRRSGLVKHSVPLANEEAHQLQSICLATANVHDSSLHPGLISKYRITTEFLTWFKFLVASQATLWEFPKIRGTKYGPRTAGSLIKGIRAPKWDP